MQLILLGQWLMWLDLMWTYQNGEFQTIFKIYFQSSPSSLSQILMYFVNNIETNACIIGDSYKKINLNGFNIYILLIDIYKTKKIKGY